MRYPVSSFFFRPGSCRSVRLPDSAFPIFAIMRLPRNVASSRLPGCVAQLLSFSSRFPVFLGWLRLSCPCCFLYLLYLLLRSLSSRLYCAAATSRLLLRRFVSPASSSFAAPLRFSDCVAPLRLFGHYSVFVFGALRPPSRRAAGAIRSTCAQLTPFFVLGELREKRAVARNFASLRGIRFRDQGCEFGQDCRSDRLAGGVRDRVLVEATV